MKLIPIQDIHISPERQRRAFDPEKMVELVEDIRSNGLFNAIVLRETDTRNFDEFNRGPFALCQGERRLRAIQDIWDLGGEFRYDRETIPQGMVPYVTLGDLNPLQAEVAELSENLCRADLTWQERAAATARIARLRTALATEAGVPPPKVAEISTEVRGSSKGLDHENTRREILLERLMSDPDIKGAKSLDEAWKVAKRKESAAKNVLLAETVGRNFTAESHQLIHADSLLWLPECAEGRYDVILTDPPYGMGADDFGDSGGRTAGEHGYSDDAETFITCLAVLAQESIRITKPQAHLYFFCDIDKFFIARNTFAANGWQVHRTPLIWHKPNNSRVPWANPPCGPQRKYELILYAVKGKRMVTNIFPDVITCNTDANLGHQAQKPVTLFTDLLKRSIRPGDHVLDPFAGSGPIIPAAHGLKCFATAVEKDAGSYGLMLGRAKAIKEEAEMEGVLS